MKNRPLQISAALARTLVERGLAQEADGILVPCLSGGDPAADSPFPAVPEDLAGLTVEELTELEAAASAAIEQVAEAPASFVSEARTSAQLLEEMQDAVEDLEAVRAELARQALEAEADEPEAEADEEPEADEPETAAAETPEALAALEAQAAELADRARAPEPEPVVEVVEPPAPITAAATPVRTRPARSRAAAPVEEPLEQVSLVAGAGAPDMPLGAEFPDARSIAEAMIRRRRSFGIIPEAMSANEVIASADWSHLYPASRKLGMDENVNEALVASVIDKNAIKAEMLRRRKGQENGHGLVASGGLCAPVTPYYQLMMISQAMRPVRAALPSFNADRGGIRFAAPPSLGSVVGGPAVGGISAAQDAFPGSSAQKSCLVVTCPPFSEVDVTAIFHCLQFGTLGARTFPERVTHFNNLVLAAQARFAESFLLSGIDAASTQVTAGNLGLGASASLLPQILAASNAMRNRHRMDPEAVLRLLMPDWAVDLIVSDVIRGQFQRFDTDEERVIALFRSFDIEPTFYIDGASGRAQVFGTQNAGTLLPFPPTVVSYLFPEGSFLHLDGGTLELGLVRDSVLNKTNDFQIFGETFENVAGIGVESIALVSTTCDSGVVTGPHAAINCPVDYTKAS